MKNFFTLLIITAIIGLAILKGIGMPVAKSPVHATQHKKDEDKNIPYLGRIQVLNGCGTDGVAHLLAEYLRRNNFDVKNIGNAENWNYPETLVISRINDTTIASQVATVLNSSNTVLIKNEEESYDVTVIVGPDYRERIRSDIR
jgi:hypothetical protein